MLTILTTTAFFVYILGFILLFGRVFARLQRYKIKNCRKKTVSDVAISIALALFWPFYIPTLSDLMVGGYGTKFWRGEINTRFNAYWYTKYIREISVKGKNCEKPDGLFIDLWEV